MKQKRKKLKIMSFEFCAAELEYQSCSKRVSSSLHILCKFTSDIHIRIEKKISLCKCGFKQANTKQARAPLVSLNIKCN